MFEMNVELNKLPDSMCFDSEINICHYEDGNDTIDIDVRGCVTVCYKDEIYRHFSDMPKELQDLFKNGKAYEDEEVVISENNWYEVFFNLYEDYDVAEIEGYTPKELEDYCKECIDLFRENK